MKPKPENLDRLLREWDGVPLPEGRLAGPVWQRIEAMQGRASWFGRVAMRLHELDGRFARPQVIAAVVVAGLLMGLGFAELRIQRDAVQADSEMSARYLAMLEPSAR